MTEAADAADVCLILEGSYPYVAGGVSSWTHDLIRAQPDLSFHLLTLVAPNSTLDLRYELPPNVTGVTVVTLQRLGKGRRKVRDQAGLMKALEPGLRGLSGKGGLEAVSSLLDALHAYGKQSREPLGSQVLLNSRQAWETLLRMYHSEFPNAAFLDYFWTWRGLFGGAYAVLLAPLPKARVYHAVSTGYAGLMMARAKLDTGAATILTEHGIYTNERRIELSMADWLYEESSLAGLVVDREKRGLRDLWMNSFESYSRATYAAADHILTLFQGNQSFQLNDGADPARMRVIPNGIDFDAYSAVEPVPDRPPTIALIGRVVPIKDVKTYIRAIAQVREVIPEVEAYLLGPYDEDPAYYAECEELVEHLHLRANFEFTGRVKLTDWMGRIDLMALTSISEGQPLVILEAGAAGIPTVATHVGACRDLIEGDDRESPPLGPGGRVVPLSNPSAAAGAMIELLRDRDKLKACGEAMRERVRRYYNKSDLDRTYRELYEQCFAGGKQGGSGLGPGVGMTPSMHTLVPFPGLAGGPPPRIDLQMATGFIADGALRISVVLRVGEMILRIPDAGVPGVVDGLWRHTCFEVFVQGEDAPAYAEFNLSPSRQWAAYRFSGYRDQGCALVMPDPGIECVRDAERLTLAATLSASALPPGSPLHIGLTAVLEDTAGKLSYWALGHTGERPDFHRADSFTLNLER